MYMMGYLRYERGVKFGMFLFKMHIGRAVETQREASNRVQCTPYGDGALLQRLMRNVDVVSLYISVILVVCTARLCTADKQS